MPTSEPTPEGVPPTLPGIPIVVLVGSISSNGGTIPSGSIELEVSDNGGDKVLIVATPATMADLAMHLLCMVSGHYAGQARS